MKLKTDTLMEDNDTLERNLAEIKQKTAQLEQEMVIACDAEIKSHAKKMEALKNTRQSLKVCNIITVTIFKIMLSIPGGVTNGGVLGVWTPCSNHIYGNLIYVIFFSKLTINHK